MLIAAAQEAWDRQLHERAINLYTEALRRDPTNTRVMVDLARAYGLRRNYAAAEKYLERAVSGAPKKAAVQCMVARTYSMIARPEKAADCYRRALELNPDSPETTTTLIELAAIHERRHQIDEAREMLGRALHREPGHEEALLKVAVLDRRCGHLDTAEAKIRDMLRQPFAAWKIHADAWHELGVLLDKRGAYPAAFEAFMKSKELRLPHRQKVARQNELAITKNREMVANLTRAHFERWAKLAADDEPRRAAVLTSHPRSGTTLLEQVLDSHEGLISADEFNIFSDWIYLPLMKRFSGDTTILEALDQLTPELRQQARTIYWERTEAVLEQPVGERILLDKNPALTFLLPAINWVFPEMRVVVAIRDPRDVVLSCFMQNVPLNSVSVNWLSLEEAAAHYARMMTTWLSGSTADHRTLARSALRRRGRRPRAGGAAVARVSGTALG